MKINLRYLNLLATIAFLSSSASAQIPEPTTNETAKDATATGTPASTADTATAGVSSVHPSAPAARANTEVRIQTSGTDHASSRVRAGPDATVNPASPLFDASQEPGFSGQGNPGSTISDSLTSRITAAQIREATMETRAKVLSELEAGLEASQRSLARFRQLKRDLGREARDQFNETTREVRASEGVLHDSLKAARRATAQQVPAALSRLADSYESYIEAVAVSEATMNASHSPHVGVAE